MIRRIKNPREWRKIKIETAMRFDGFDVLFKGKCSVEKVAGTMVKGAVLRENIIKMYHDGLHFSVNFVILEKIAELGF